MSRVSPMSADAFRMPQLDGLRAVGILLMLLHHWTPPSHPVARLFVWGGIGAMLFFVLSGYLVTGLLLRLRRAADAGVATRWHCVHQFTIRRALRLFPVYYAVLGLMTVLDYPGVRQGLAWHLTFATNFQIALGHEPPGAHPAAPFWTLAVEQQFYLLWPLLILWVPRRGLAAAVIGATLGAPVFVYAAVRLGFPGNVGLMMPACLQFLGTGAILALADYPEYAAGLTRRRVVWTYLLLAVPGLAAFAVLELAGVSAPWFGWAQALVRGGLCAMLAACVIASIAHGLPGFAGRALTTGPLALVGHLSYGVYAYHTFVATTLMLLANHPPLRAALGLTAVEARACARFFPLRLAVVLLVAACSWRLFERRIANLKHRFPYPKAPPPPRPPPPPLAAGHAPDPTAEPALATAAAS